MTPDSLNQLDAVIAEYIQAVESGQVPNRQELLARHADLADDLRIFFAQLDHVDQLAAPLRLDPTGDEPPCPVPPDRIRYFGDYELLEEIARGGMGIVYKARQTSLNRIVALKMILKATFATPRDVARFRAEAEAAANLDHPNIVPIYEVGEHDGHQYYSMRFIEGRPLNQVSRGGIRNEVECTLTIARAIHYAHQRGILHRDLKPSNILMGRGEAEDPHITDFGLAKRLDANQSLTESGQIVGTPRYMAPEQAGGCKDLTIAADVYSLGVILYERLTGQTPFTGDNALTIMRQVRETQAPRPSSITAGLDRDLETVVLKCLEKEPAKRYASAADLADDLDRWRRGEPILARPVGMFGRFTRWCKRNPAIAALISAVIVVAAAGGGVSAYLAARKSDADAAKESESRKAVRLRYVTDFRLAQQAWEEYQIPRVHELLDGLRPESTGGEDLRHYEWFHLWRLSHLEIASLNDFTFHVLDVVSTVGGQNLAFGVDRDDQGKIVNIETGAVKAVLQRRMDPESQSAAFSPDGGLLATTSKAVIQVWDTENGRELITLRQTGDSFRSIAISPNNQRLAAAGFGLPSFPAIANREIPIFVWDLRTGKELAILKATKSVYGLAFSPNSDFIATADYIADPSNDGTVTLWEAKSGKLMETLSQARGFIRCLAFSPDGRKVAGGSEGNVWIWEAFNSKPHPSPHAFTHNPVRHLHGTNDVFSSLAFSPDGNYLATGAVDKTLRLWDLTYLQEIAVFREPADGNRDHSFVTSTDWISISRDGARLVTGAYKARVWDVQSARKLTMSPASTVMPAISPDGKRFAYFNSVVTIHSTETGAKVAMLGENSDTVVLRATFSPDGHLLATASTDQVVRIWDLRTSQERMAINGDFGRVNAVAFSPDSRLVAIGTDDGTLRIWDAVLGREAMAIKAHVIVDGQMCLDFSPDGQHVATGSSNEGTVRIWDIKTGNESITLDALTGGVAELQYSPRGDRLAVAWRQIRLFDTSNGNMIAELGGDNALTERLAFSRDGQRFAAYFRNGAVRIFDASTAKDLLKLNGSQAITAFVRLLGWVPPPAP